MKSIEMVITEYGCIIFRLKECLPNNFRLSISQSWTVRIARRDTASTTKLQKGKNIQRSQTYKYIYDYQPYVLNVLIG